MITGLATALVVLAGCGVSVAVGGESAARHPASGIFEAPTDGAGNISGFPATTLAYQPPASTPPSSLPSGLTATTKAVESALKGGCWQDAHAGNVYGAYDQLFWWQGDCGDSAGQVTVELYPAVGVARSEAHHAAALALLTRYREGAVLVDVYSNAPLQVVSQLASVSGLQAVPGYGA